MASDVPDPLPGFDSLVSQLDNLSLCLKVSMLKDLCASFKQRIELMEKTFAESSPIVYVFFWTRHRLRNETNKRLKKKSQKEYFFS